MHSIRKHAVSVMNSVPVNQAHISNSSPSLPLTDAGNCEDSPGEEKIQKEIETIDYIDKWVNDKYSNYIDSRDSHVVNTIRNANSNSIWVNFNSGLTRNELKIARAVNALKKVHKIRARVGRVERPIRARQLHVELTCSNFKTIIVY